MVDQAEKKSTGHLFDMGGAALPHRSSGDCGRGDLSDTDRQGSLGQAQDRDHTVNSGVSSRGGGVLSSHGLVDLEDTESDALQSGTHHTAHSGKPPGKAARGQPSGPR
jgi:hypothetical protein